MMVNLDKNALLSTNQIGWGEGGLGLHQNERTR